MKQLDFEALTEWLGPEGAVAGLEKSNLTNAELMVHLRNRGIEMGSKVARRQLTIELIMSPIKRIDKPRDFLLGMSSEELKRYFGDRMVSNKELMDLLDDLEIAPTGKLRGKLSDYAAQEIGDLGMFQRVAKGSASKN